MPAVGADDSGEHERDYRRSGRGRKSVKASSTAPAASSRVRWRSSSGSLAMLAAMRRASSLVSRLLTERRCERRETAASRVGGRTHQRPRLAQLSPFYGWEEKARREAGL